METILTISDIKGFIRRRAKQFILPFSVIMIVAMIVAVALPPIYRSRCTLLVEAQQIPQEYVKSTVTSYADQRLEVLTREILKFRTLKGIIQEFDLYPELMKKGDFGSAVEEMKASLNIESKSSDEKGSSFSAAYILSYDGDDPQKVFAVVDRLSKLILEKEARAREVQTAATTSFLENEQENLKQLIDTHEKKVSAFKQKYVGALPGSSATNLRTLERLQSEVNQLNSRIRSLKDRKIYLNGELANVEPLKPIQTDSGKLAANPQERLRALRLNLIREQARLSDKHPDIKKIISEIEKLERQVGSSDLTVVKVKQLHSLRAELKEMKAIKGEKHPDVINVERQIDKLAGEVDALVNQNATADLVKVKPDNPAYINIMTQIVSADLEIKNLNEDIAQITESIKEYRHRVEIAPIVEQEYNELTLDYNSAKKRYNEITSKLLNSRVAQEMDTQQHGEHFTIISPAYVPLKPFKPNRLLIVLLGFVLGSGAGLGAVAFTEATDYTIKSSKELLNIEGVELLTTMPYTPTYEEIRHRWFKRLAVAIWCLGIFGIVLVAVDKLIWPLGDVLSVVFERMGLAN